MNLTYFIADAHGFVKIGKMTRRSLRNRFLHLQLANSQPLFLLAVSTTPEAECHARFAALHERREGFRLESGLLDWLAIRGDFEPLADRVARTQAERFVRAYAAFSQQWTPRRLRELAAALLRESK